MKTEVKIYSGSKCPDSIFGQIQYNNVWGWKAIDDNRKNLLQKEAGDIEKIFKKLDNGKDEYIGKPCILLILESPHINEYKDPNNPCAANGTTGKNIGKYLCNIFNNIGVNKKICKNNSSTLIKFLNKNQLHIINILVVNSVQYQCSLGIEPICHIIKEENWMDEWFSNRNDFISRLGKIYSKNSCFIINLCTSGVFVPMKTIVKDNLHTKLNVQNNYCEGPHPSSWSRLKKIEFK